MKSFNRFRWKGSMRTITLSLKTHKGEERIFVEFPYNRNLDDAVRQVPGIRWSQTTKRWHLPSEKNSIKALQQKVNQLAIIDTSVLKTQLEERKKPSLAVLSPAAQKIMPHELCAD